MMLVAGNGFEKQLAVRKRRCIRSEEPLAKIVIDSDDVEALTGKAFNTFRAHEAGRSGYDNSLQIFSVTCFARTLVRKAPNLLEMRLGQRSLRIPSAIS